MNIEQIYRIMRASSERYTSIETDVNERIYRNEAGQERDIQQAIAVTRWTPFLQYCEIEKCMFNIPTTQSNRDLHHIETYLIDKYKGKQLLNMPEKKRVFQGVISETTPILKRKIAVYSLYWTAWSYSFYDWIEITQVMDELTVKQSDDSDLYVLERQLNSEDGHTSSTYQLFIDPKKGYLPVRELTIVIQDDKTLISHNKEWMNFQEVNGLWIPTRFTWYNKEAKTGGEYTFDSIRINEAIPKEAFKIEFPEGTEVADRLLGDKYIIGSRTSKESATIEPIDDDNDINTVMMPPATDIELEEAASKAQDLIKQTEEANKPKPVEIYPNFVWVEPGRRDYALTIAPESIDGIVLNRHQFEEGEIILHTLQDHLSTTGKIILSVERPESMTGYAEGILELDFGGQMLKIHLIAPPLSN